MQFEIFVHGTPNGQQLLGNSSEVFGRFVQTFYAANTSEIAEKLRVDRLTIGENSTLFYSLVIARGVLGDDGREGGYVALSLQLDSLARNTFQVYDLLKALYLTKVLGRIVRTKEGGKVQFVSSKLSSVGGNYISELEQFVANYIKENIGLAGFAPIPREEKKGASRAGVARINRLDLAENRVVSLLLQGNSIEISDEFPSQTLASQVEELCHKLEASESGASRKLAEMQAAHEQATASVEQKWQCKIDQLAQENAADKKKSQEQIRTLTEERNSLAKQVEQIKTKLQSQEVHEYLVHNESDLKRLAQAILAVFGLGHSQQGSAAGRSAKSASKAPSLGRWMPIANLVLTLICALLLTVVLVFFRPSKGDNMPAPLPVQHDTIYLENPPIDSADLSAPDSAAFVR